MKLPMLVATRWTSKLLLVLAAASILTGCSLFAEQSIKKSFGPKQKVYRYKYETVWRAVQIATQKYALKRNNMDRGLLETDVIRGYDVWRPPYSNKPAPGGYRYQLEIRVVKGRKIKGRPSTKVLILKRTSLKKDFFADSKQVGSDGFEELSLLYRINREIKIDRTIQRVQRKKNN